MQKPRRYSCTTKIFRVITSTNDSRALPRIYAASRANNNNNNLSSATPITALCFDRRNSQHPLHPCTAVRHRHHTEKKSPSRIQFALEQPAWPLFKVARASRLLRDSALKIKTACTSLRHRHSVTVDYTAVNTLR